MTEGWVIVEAETSCGMTTDYQGKGDTSLTILLAVDGSVAIALQNSGWSAVKGEVYTITYVLNDHVYETRAVGVDGSGGKRGFMAKFGQEIVSDLAKGSALHVFRDQVPVARLRLDGSAAALKVLRQCAAAQQARASAEKMRIPDDPFAKPQSPKSALEAEARGNPANWISVADYPAAAIRLGAEGNVGIAWTIDTEGRITNCRVTETSGNTDLDQAACIAITRRGRYTPARDQNGDPVEGHGSRVVRWKLPEN